ncbi:protein tyrosine phosphatase [Pseudohyphozyma bogoriensis]|nr:protein tyrosine phosphatase [Pseudohyphozyma bogoriensis]
MLTVHRATTTNKLRIGFESSLRPTTAHPRRVVAVAIAPILSRTAHSTTTPTEAMIPVSVLVKEVRGIAEELVKARMEAQKEAQKKAKKEQDAYRKQLEAEKDKHRRQVHADEAEEKKKLQEDHIAFRVASAVATKELMEQTGRYNIRGAVEVLLTKLAVIEPSLMAHISPLSKFSKMLTLPHFKNFVKNQLDKLCDLPADRTERALKQLYVVLLKQAHVPRMDCIKVSSVPQVRLAQRSGSGPLPAGALGSLHLTTHHVLWTGPEGAETWIPLPLLYSVTRSPANLTGTSHPLILRTRDFQVYELIFSQPEEADGVWESLKGLCASLGSGGLEGLYAYFYDGGEDRKGKKKEGWDVYQPEKEFKRMGLGTRSSAWRVSKINNDFEFCPTYPADIVVPAKISDSTLTYAVKYRSKGRIPGLVYLHWANLGSITRSSQPMVGMKNARSIQDEKLIQTIFHSHSQHSTVAPRQNFTLASSSSFSALDGVIFGAQATNLIIDARPTANAYANSVKGAGSENMDHYKDGKKEYLGIDNIHVMRASLAGIYDALRESETTGHLDRSALRRTSWLKHLTNILEGILLITRTVHLSNSHVLVHCSDGWDRTSQLSSLSELCLDPYYRTGEGLAVLIEKDWLSYGHRFADRNGHLCSDKTQFVAAPVEGISAQQAFLASVQKQFAGSSHAFKETSPVFQQFLDCIYQIQKQFPDRFEFNEKLLRKLQWEAYAGRSGSFLFNSEKQRGDMRARERTRSVWEEVFEFGSAGEVTLKEEFRNAEYNKVKDDPNSREDDADQGVLMLDPLNVKFWYELFGRDDEEMNGRPGVEPVEGETLETPTVVESSQDDPVVNPLGAAMRGVTISPPTSSPSSWLAAPSPSSRSASPSNSPASRSPNSGPSLPSQAQLAGAASAVQKFGWGAWKAAQRQYQDAVTQYRDSQASSSASPASTPTVESGHSRTANGESSGSGWRATNDGAELGNTWSGVSTPTGSKPSTPAPSSPVKMRSGYESSAPPPAQPRSPVVQKTPLPPLTPTKSAPPPSEPSRVPDAPAPAPVAPPSVNASSWVSDPRRAADNSNPWERAASPIKSRSTAPQTSTIVKEKEQSSAGGGDASGASDFDPLGVGFS